MRYQKIYTIKSLRITVKHGTRKCLKKVLYSYILIYHRNYTLKSPARFDKLVELEIIYTGSKLSFSDHLWLLRCYARLTSFPNMYRDKQWNICIKVTFMIRTITDCRNVEWIVVTTSPTPHPNPSYIYFLMLDLPVLSIILFIYFFMLSFI